MVTELKVRNSERTTYRRCRLRWHWAWVLGYVPERESVHLRFGSLVHEAMAQWFVPGIKRGTHPAETFERLYVASLEAGEYEFKIAGVDAGELGVQMLNRYVDHYGNDGKIEILAPEQQFAIDIYHPKTGKYIFTAVGTFDAVARDRSTGKIILLEHKTAASIDLRHLGIDDQAGTYWALAGTWLQNQGALPPGEEIDGILYNYLRKAKDDDRPQNEDGHYLNKDGSVSKNQPPPYFERKMVRRGEEDRRRLMERLTNQAWEMRKVREGKLPIYKNSNYLCARECPFFDICELHEAGADWEAALEMECNKWDPLADHVNDHNLPEGALA